MYSTRTSNSRRRKGQLPKPGQDAKATLASHALAPNVHLTTIDYT